MYTEKQVDDMLSQVEKEFEKALDSIAKNEEVETEVEASEELETEEVIAKSEETEEVETEESEYETVDELYGSMTKSEIEAHYNSIKKIMFGEELEKAAKRDHAEGDTAMDEFYPGKEEKEKLGEDYEDLSPHAKEQMAKERQKKASKEAGFGKAEDESEETEVLAKSENEVKLEEENEELKKNLETVNELLGKLFNKEEAPKGKAITNTDYIAKSEEAKEEGKDFASMSKSEVTSKLKSIDYSELSKSDRNAINEYCLKNTSVETIKHLLR
jgi:hypothetical protein